MKCHYIYTEEGEKVLIPGCMAVAVSGDIEDCTCRSKKTFAEFEREEYNKAIKALPLNNRVIHERKCSELNQ